MRKLACLALAAVAVLCSCSKESSKKTDAQSATPQGVPAPQTRSKHKFAKAIEVAGIRLSEKGVGKLQAKFGVVNHSIADLGEVGLRVALRARGAKPDDPPLAQFPCKVALGPEEWKEVTVDIPTKLRVYELPDWQFIDATFEITSPPE